MRAFHFIIIGIVLLHCGCWATKAPDVAPGSPAASSDNVAQQGSAISQDLCPSSYPSNLCGTVNVEMQTRSPNDYDWIYWKAGDSGVSYLPDQSYVESASWDMRIMSVIPIIGTNGGEARSATYKKRKMGCASGAASFAAWTSSSTPSSTSDAQSLTYSEDHNQPLQFSDAVLSKRLHNPIVNQIGSGLCSQYNAGTHEFKLSGNIFILKSANGIDYYAVRFVYYSITDLKLVFQWRRLKNAGE